MKKTKIYEGRTKKLYESEKANELIQEFKDDVLTKESGKKITIKEKGIINKEISSYLFRYLDSYNIPTHYLSNLSDREILVKKLDMIPIAVLVRNVAADDLVSRYGIEEGKELECPIIEYYLKDEERKDPMINEDHVIAFGHASTDELKEIHRMSSKINAILKDFFKRRNLKLIDLTLEYGRADNDIYLGDEISPETCRFVDLQTNKKLGRNSLEPDVAKAKENLLEIRNRILRK